MTAPAGGVEQLVGLAEQAAALAEQAAKLNQVRAEAEERLFPQLADDYSAGRLSAATLYATFRQIKEHKTPGFVRRWDAAMPHEVQERRIRWTGEVYLPDEDGNWRGEVPLARHARTPRPKASVVYVLFDAENKPCYVGSTDDFRVRIKRHQYDGKAFVRWLAYPCRDRSHAYRLEEKLLSEHQPYLNQKATR